MSVKTITETIVNNRAMDAATASYLIRQREEERERIITQAEEWHRDLVEAKNENARLNALLIRQEAELKGAERHFVFIIGSNDYGFHTEEDLVRPNDPASHYYFSINASSKMDGSTFEEMALFIGWGLAFQHDWCQDGTVWTLRETTELGNTNGSSKIS